MTALHSFFAQSLPLAPSLQIVDDNAKGLTKDSAISERRRLFEFHLASPAAGRDKLSRWESELPALSTYANSPPAPERRESVQAVDVLPDTLKMIAPPHFPRRRTSVDEEEGCGKDDDTMTTADETNTSHSRESHSTLSSRSHRSTGSADYALAPPRRRTSCLAWLDEVEANDLLMSQSREDELLSQTRLHPRSLSRKSPTEMILAMDAKLAPTPKENRNSDSRRSKIQHAPRRPRRMKSMEPDDILPHQHHQHDSSAPSHDEGNLRLTLSDSIHSVMEQVKLVHTDDASEMAPDKLTNSEQLALKDAVKGVVGALARRSSATTMTEAKERGTTKGKGTKKTTSPTRRRRGSSPRVQAEGVVG